MTKVATFLMHFIIYNYDSHDLPNHEGLVENSKDEVKTKRDFYF